MLVWPMSRQWEHGGSLVKGMKEKVETPKGLRLVILMDQENLASVKSTVAWKL